MTMKFLEKIGQCYPSFCLFLIVRQLSSTHCTIATLQTNGLRKYPLNTKMPSVFWQAIAFEPFLWLLYVAHLWFVRAVRMWTLSCSDSYRRATNFSINLATHLPPWPPISLLRHPSLFLASHLSSRATYLSYLASQFLWKYIFKLKLHKCPGVHGNRGNNSILGTHKLYLTFDLF